MKMTSNEINLKDMLGTGFIEKEFLEMRKIFLWSLIDDDLAKDVIKKTLYLDMKNQEEDITVFINSPGGSITSGLAIYDAFQNCKSDIATVCMGQAASMGAILLASGQKGKRSAWTHARIMIHQPLISGQMVAPAADLEIQADEMLRLREKVNTILADHTNQPVDRIKADTERDHFFGASEAVDYGLIDFVSEEISRTVVSG